MTATEEMDEAGTEAGADALGVKEVSALSLEDARWKKRELIEDRWWRIILRALWLYLMHLPGNADESVRSYDFFKQPSLLGRVCEIVVFRCVPVARAKTRT